MNLLKIKPVPSDLFVKLPFELSEAGLKKWLQALTLKDSDESSQSLLFLLNYLKVKDMELKLKLAFLNEISPSVEILAAKLELEYLDTGLPLEDEEQKSAEMVVWLYWLLLENYTNINSQLHLNQKNIGKSEKTQIIYKVLLYARQVQLQCSEVYTLPQYGFWIKCYRAYGMAEKYGVLKKSVPKTDSKIASIESIFKQIVVFACSETACFRPREMKIIEQLLEDVSSHILITDSCSDRASGSLFQFSLKKDKAPERYNLDADLNEFQRFIDTGEAAKAIYNLAKKTINHSTTEKALKKNQLIRLIKTLGIRQRREFTRLPTKNEENAIGYIGMSNVVNVMAKILGVSDSFYKEKLKDNSRITGSWKLPNFDLVPMGEEQAYQFQQHHQKKLAKNSKIFQAADMFETEPESWNQQSDKILAEDIPEGLFDIVDSSIKGYGLVSKSGENKIKVGEVFAVQQGQTNPVEVGLVRRINRLADGSLRLGIECIGLNAELVWLRMNSYENQKDGFVVFIPKVSAVSALSHSDSILVKSGQLKVGQTVTLNRKGDKIICKLRKLFQETAAISHFELDYTID